MTLELQAGCATPWAPREWPAPAQGDRAGVWTPGHRMRATSTLRYAARTTTATIMLQPRSKRAQPRSWWSARRACRANSWCPIHSRALQHLGAWARRQWGGTVVGVTGSAGKTTTKDAIAHLLAAEMPVGKTVGQLQQSRRSAALHSAPARRLPRRCPRNGHESRRRNSRAGRHRAPGDRRRHQRGLRARGVLRFHRRRRRAPSAN